MNPVLNSRIDLSDFLASIERRAFKQAMFAVKNREVALDVVQDAMMKLSEKYSARPANEWPMLRHLYRQSIRVPTRVTMFTRINNRRLLCHR